MQENKTRSVEELKKELDRKGIAYDDTMSREELEALLKDAEGSESREQR